MKKIFLFAAVLMLAGMTTGCVRFSRYSVMMNGVEQTKMEAMKMEDVKSLKSKHNYKFYVARATLTVEGKKKACDLADFLAKNQPNLFTADANKGLPVILDINVGKGVQSNEAAADFRAASHTLNQQMKAFVRNSTVEVRLNTLVAKQDFQIEEYALRQPVETDQQSVDLPNAKTPFAMDVRVMKDPMVQYVIAQCAGSFDQKTLTNWANHRPKNIR